MSTAPLVAAALLAASVLVGHGHRRPAVRPPLPGAGHARAARPARTSGGWSSPGVQRLVAAGAGAAAALLVGGTSGAVVGVLVALAVRRGVRRLPSLEGGRARLALRADLPLAGDLLAACVTAGAPVPQAVTAVGRAVGGPLGQELGRVALGLELGAAPRVAWETLLADPVTATLARPLVRASERGSPPATVLAQASAELRREAYDRAAAAAEVAAVRAVGPLGLCFLPAFVLLGVVPLVAGLAGMLLGTR